MYTLEELVDREIVYEGRKSVIYRGKKDNKPVILKMFRNTFPTVKDVVKLKKEYEIARSLDFGGIAKPVSLEKQDNFLALVYEDIGGVSLSQTIQKTDLDLKAKLRIAIQIVEALEFIHQNEVIHMDIKPDNVIVNLEKNLLQVIDFGISTRLSRENPSIMSPENLEGTLVYISPEQTGRMNRSIDYRTDFYSLGVTLFELFTGKLPFTSNDSMEIVHYHIAVEPKEPHLINSKIPLILSRIILRLMAKNAEDRYQSAHGLKRDLEKCLEVSNNEQFELGLHDKSGKFQIPQKLYGREDECQTLLNAFYTVSDGNSKLVIVKGYSGIGKSVLVNEIHKPIVEKRGYFISGKFDQFKRDIPYFAIIQAFRELVKQVLTESEESIFEWKKSLLEAVGSNGQVLIDIIPEVELIIGKQPPAPELNITESQNRFNLIFKEFVKVFTTAEHPLAIFIDDMQWADSASFKFMESILTDPEIQYLLFISSYRDNEVDETHPLLSTLSNLKASNTKIETITLKSLELTHIIQLISDTLKSEVDNPKLHSLADMVIKKTGGNPFFVNEFLKSLYQEKLLNFNTQIRDWEWDASLIESKGITDNVVELISGKIQRLNKTSQHLLQLASCIGSSFQLNILAMVNNVSIQETLSDLAEVVKGELILVLGDGYKYLLDAQSKSDGEMHLVSDVQFKFLHDRVQQAAYLLIPGDEKKQVHLTIGRHILSNLSTGLSRKEKELSSPEVEENIFDIVNHLNTAVTLITVGKEKLKLAELNLIAGKKATKSAAFNSALQYFNEGIKSVSQDDWTFNHDLIWQLYKEKASSEFSNALYAESEQTIQLLLNKCHTQEEKVEVYKIYLNVLFQANKHHEGLAVMREALKYLGMTLPKSIGKHHITASYAKFRFALGRRKPKDLLDLPEIQNRRMYNICSVIYDTIPSANIVHTDTMGYLGLLMGNICLKYGNSDKAAFAYCMVASVVEGVTKQFQLAYDFSMMAIQLNEKYPDNEGKARVFFVTGNFVLHWVKPVDDHLPLVLSAFRTFQEAGNLPWANYSKVFNRTQSIFFNKKLLPEIIEENHFCYKLHSKSKDREAILNQYRILGFLQSQLADTLTLPEDLYGFNEEEYEKEMGTPGNNITRCYYYVLKNIECFNEKNYVKALEFGWKGFKIVHEVLGIMLDFPFRYYFNLTYLASYSELSRLQKLKYGFVFRVNKLLIKLSAKKNPGNFLAHHYLLLAEENRVQKNYKIASDYYDSASLEAQKAGFWHNIGLVNELAANYYLSINQNNHAIVYLLNARHAYHKWGATAKVKYIDEHYPNLLNSVISKLDIEADIEYEETITKGTTHSSTKNSKRFTTKVLDFNSVFKASQTLSGEIVLEKLLEKLMRVLLENAGATDGYLLFANDKQLYIEASGSISSKEITVLQSIPIKDFADISSNIVNYVLRTKENVVLNDALKEGNFTNDPHIRNKEIHSVLCAPILNQGKLVGIIYLENNLTTGAFTNERVEVLQVLASQAAISIDNAKLYDNLEQKVLERTKKLNEALEEVNALKDKQDGDYYLTSLILKPLGKNFAISDSIKMDFFVKQKKQFHFRQWDSEIGGDINTAYNIKLKEKKYVVFANADAMGKSIQGAGGALVFGSVFKAAIERTNSDPLLSNFFPEQWLKNIFIELHKVFISFDGSMLMSLVLGLIDESTGLLYYINVEHPAPILYRNKKAEFLPSRRAYFKLGTQEATGGFMLETFSLLKGDVIISGSDGRDDLIIGKDPITKQSIINEDENEILSSIEIGEGDPQRIYESILSKGEQMDDLSLLKIEYIKDSEEREDKTQIEQAISKVKGLLKENKIVESIQILNSSLEVYPESKKLLKEIIQILLNDKKYKDVIEYLERFIDIYPNNIQYIHYTSFCYRKIAMYKNAIELGERILIREPGNLKNLENISKSYLGFGDQENFKKMEAKIDSLNKM